MTIRRVEARTITLPITKPTSMSTRALDRREFVVVEIESDDAVGVGYTYAGTRGGRLTCGALLDLLAPVLVGSPATDIAALWEKMYQETLLVGRRGLVIRALSAVDIALWDLAGKRLGAPLAVLLGAAPQALSAYASGGYYRAEDGPWAEAVAAEIKYNQSLGFDDHKIKVGGLTVAEDAERVAAAIDTMGGVGRLALDANNAYSSVPEALAATREFEAAAGSHGLWWMEEPLSPDDVEGHAQLARELETTIATGEIHQTRHEFRQLIAAGAADVLQPDAGVLGGVTEWMRVARTAESFGLQVAPHWHANLHVHLAAASPNCLTVEHFVLEKEIYNFETLLTPETHLEFRDGTVIVPDRPGLGIEFDADQLARYDTSAG